MDCSVKFGKAAYYREAARILGASVTFRVLAKTPSLFITSQRRAPYQRAYYKRLIRALDSRKVTIKYLFSLPLTRDELLRESRRTALRDLRAWQKFSTDPKISLRFIERPNPFSCVIGDRQTAVLLRYPKRGCALLANGSYYLRAFERLFETASSNHISAIAKIKRAILAPASRPDRPVLR